jgi:tetratricopeptide (TPR) repeat protein
MFRPTLLVLLFAATATFAQQPEEEAPQFHPCPLQGLKEGRLTITESAVELFDGKKRVASANVPELQFNSAKGSVECKGTQISLSSQMPYKATVRSTSLSWKQGKLQVGETRTEDPSAESLAQVEKKLKEGDIEAALKHLEDIFYPHQYYNEFDMAARILQRAHEAASKRFKGKDVAGAAKVLETAFEHFSEHSVHPEGREIIPAARLAAIRNDYGFFLAEAGRLEEAEKELREVVAAAPERAVARLNLADVLWAQGKKEEADTQYREYAKRMPRKKWPANLPQRCPYCAANF